MIMSFEDQFINNTTFRFKFFGEIPIELEILGGSFPVTSIRKKGSVAMYSADARRSRLNGSSLAIALVLP